MIFQNLPNNFNLLILLSKAAFELVTLLAQFGCQSLSTLLLDFAALLNFILFGIAFDIIFFFI